MRIIDSLTNLVAGLGTSRDKASYDRFSSVELQENELDAMFSGDWVARKIVTLPVRDMMRAWRTWSAPPAAVTAFEDAEKRHAVRAKIADAMEKARLYGGSVILIGADTADPMQPLNPSAIKRGGLQYLTVLPRRGIVPGPAVRDPRSPYYLQPGYYDLATGTGGNTRMHPSRVVRFIGAERHDLAGEQQGWGNSVLQAPYDAVRQAALVGAATSSLVHEAKVDVINVPNLGAVLQSTDGTQAMMRRFQNASLMKSINGTLLLGADETWNRTQTSFTNLPQLFAQFLSTAAAAADIPASRFLAQSPGGLNASGDTDTRNYYDHLASERERLLCPRLDVLDAVLWADAAGSVPQGATYTWAPLWQPTEKEQADTGKVIADTVSTLVSAAILDEGALRVGVENRLIESGLFPGLEQALASAAVAADPAIENDPADPVAPAGKAAPGAADASGRTRLAALADSARERHRRHGTTRYH